MTDLFDTKFIDGSHSKNGNAIPIPAAAVSLATAVTLFASSCGASEWDVVTLVVANNSGGNLTLTLDWNGATLKVLALNGYMTLAIDRAKVRGGLTIKGYETTGSGALVVLPEFSRLTPVSS